MGNFTRSRLLTSDTVRDSRVVARARCATRFRRTGRLRRFAPLPRTSDVRYVPGVRACVCAALERRHPVEVLEHVVERFDVAELGVDVEQVPLDDAGDAVTDRLAHDDRPEAFGHSVLDGLAD